MSERRESMDSCSSISSNEQRKRRARFGIKKKLVHNKGLFHSLAGEKLPTDQNISTLSFTEYSDSDQSMIDGKSNIDYISDTNSKKNRKQTAIPDEGFINPLQVEYKYYYHPHANQLSPFEEWKQALVVGMESSYFFFYEIIVTIFSFIFGIITKIFLLPFAFIGLLAEQFRLLVKKCKKEKSPFSRSKSKSTLLSTDGYMDTPTSGDLIIVLDLDMTLIYSTLEKPSDKDSNYIKINNKKYGGELYVYLRPYLNEFLNEISSMGQVAVFTSSEKEYADPIINKIDTKKIIKRRFYRDHCKTDSKGNIQKNMELVTKNTSKLVIIDDAQLTYNMYKKNTIKVEEWTKNKKNDIELLKCRDIIDQLRYTSDVSKDLKQIIDILKAYN